MTGPVVLDLDGVLAEYCGAFHKLLRKHGAGMRPFETPQGPSMWEWYEAYGASPWHIEAAWSDIVANPAWWTLLAPHPDLTSAAREALTTLVNVHDAWVVTARPHEARSWTVQWCERMLRLTPAVLTTQHPKHKVAFLATLQPSVVIEDNAHTLRALKPLCPDATLLLVDRPYNQGLDSEGVERVGSTHDALALAHRLLRASRRVFAPATVGRV